MDQFQIHQINDTDDHYFDGFWRIYDASFPSNEKRTLKQQALIFTKSEFRINVFIIDNQVIGFITYWTAEDFIFIEHLAIAPEFRNQGFGNAILNSFIRSYNKPIVLEIEIPVDKITRQRLHFYESLEFKINEHIHFQPPYHTGDNPVPMKILSHPFVISDKDYQQFALYQKEIVLS